MVGFVAAFEVCMCRNPVVFFGLSGLNGFICFGFVNFSLFVCMCVWYEGTKV